MNPELSSGCIDGEEMLVGIVEMIGDVIEMIGIECLESVKMKRRRMILFECEEELLVKEVRWTIVDVLDDDGDGFVNEGVVQSEVEIDLLNEFKVEGLEKNEFEGLFIELFEMKIKFVDG